MACAPTRLALEEMEDTSGGGEATVQAGTGDMIEVATAMAVAAAAGDSEAATSIGAAALAAVAGSSLTATVAGAIAVETRTIKDPHPVVHLISKARLTASQGLCSTGRPCSAWHMQLPQSRLRGGSILLAAQLSSSQHYIQRLEAPSCEV